MTDVNLTAIEMYRGNQAIFVSSDVENNQISYLISSRKCIAQLAKTAELTSTDHLIPPGKRAFTVGMFFPELEQGFPGDNIHDIILSQYEIIDKGNLLFIANGLFLLGHLPTSPLDNLLQYDVCNGVLSS